MHIGFGFPDLILCAECEKAVTQKQGKLCHSCAKKKMEYEKKNGIILDFWMGGKKGVPGSAEPGT